MLVARWDLCCCRWVFLFDKVMLVCRKARGVFDQRYVVKQVYQVAQLRVEVMMPQSRTAKVSYSTACCEG